MNWTTVTDILMAVHRATWRVVIFIWLALFFAYSNSPSDRTPLHPSLYVFLTLILNAFYIAAELRHPRPHDLGFSNPSIANYAFGLAGIACVLSWLIQHLVLKLDFRADTPWLLYALAGTATAYLLRPRPRAID